MPIPADSPSGLVPSGRSGLIDLNATSQASGSFRMPQDTGRFAPATVEEPRPQSTGPNLFAIVLRRWPLLLVGAIAGLVLGYLYYVQKPRVYQSGAQLLVIKKRAEMVGQNDVRLGVLEDHVATQVTLIKSETTLLMAARRIGTNEGGVELPDDDRARAGFLAGGLTVVRDKDSASMTGSGVLNIGFKAGTPDGSRRLLDAVIKAYQAELVEIYDEATRTRMKSIDSLLRRNQSQLDTLTALIGTTREQLRKITEEELANIRSRVSLQREKELALELDQLQLDKQLRQIAAAGKNRSKRMATLAQLTAQVKLNNGGVPGEKLDMAGPDVTLKLLEAERQELAERLGKDHPDLKRVVARIAFYKDLYKRENPEETSEEIDELWAVEQRIKQMKATVDDQLTLVKAQLRTDRDTLDAAGSTQDKLTVLNGRATTLDTEIHAYRKELLQLEATSSAGGFDAKVITEPGLGYQVAPVLMQCLLAGAMLGLVAGAGLGYLAELADQSFRSPEEIRQRLGLAIIGTLPRIQSAGAESTSPVDGMLVTVHRPKSSEAEMFRGVRTQLYFNTQGRGHQVIQVTSANPGDGKSTLAANLAVSIAQSGKRVALIDADFRKPRVHKIFALPQCEFGLASVVAGEIELGKVVCPSGVPNLDLLPCGPRPANPAELLTSPGFLKAITDLRAAYDFVIIDTPPVLAVSDPITVAPRADGVILVIKMTNRIRPQAERAREQLGVVGANMLGVVVNGAAAGGKGYDKGYKYGYNYQYQYQYEYAESYADEAKG